MDDKASTEKIEKTAPLPSPEAHPAEQSDQVAAAMGQQAMPSWQSAVRDAYLARAAVSASAEAGGAAQADPSTAVSIRDAYMARLGAGVTEVADAGASRDYLLRSVYAARSGSVREGASDARRRATPKKTRAARKKARKAATHKNRNAGPVSKKAGGKALARALGVNQSRKPARSAKPARSKATRSTRVGRGRARRRSR